MILDGEPSERIVNSLRKHIGNHGTVISWYKKFENSRNKELSKIMVEDDLKKFILGLVDRTYDLMDIVENQYYVHPGFEGRSSIKKVLPVIARLMGHEEILSYKKLEVHNGTDAIEAYRKITTRELTGELAKEKEKHMLEYCKLDTYAMYEIWNHLQDLIK